MKKLLLAWMLSLPLTATAIVDMKNANFSNTWVDLEAPGVGFDLRIARTYNSKSLFVGMFGYGWCSDFETSLSQTAEGNIKLTECGAGQELFFLPRQFGQKEINQTIDKIVAKVRAAKRMDESNVKQFVEDLRKDNDLRARLALAWKVSQPVKEGGVFFANGREVDQITYSKGVYSRQLPDGSSQRFNQQGRLTHMYDKNGNFLRFTYAQNGTIREVQDNNGRKLTFNYFNNKKVQKVTGPLGMSAEYKFKNLDDLSWVQTANKSIYEYTYDDTHNMTRATFPDKTFIQIAYDVKNDWVTSFRDREGCVESYDYKFNPQNQRMNYWANVKKTCGKQVTNESRHEFWYATRQDGMEYLQRAMSTVNGNITDINYHETYGKPTMIRRNSETAHFEYYNNGLVRTKASARAKLTYEYDKDSRKVAKVTTDVLDDKMKVVSKRTALFRYDKKGNLVNAENSDGQKVVMTHDNQGRILTITDQAKKLVRIQYENRFGKPGRVERPGLGSLNIAYKQDGNIDKATSPEGPTVAMQIASTFNNYLDVIAPATAEVFQ